MEYLNFDIHIGPGFPYPVTVDHSHIGEAEGALHLVPNSPGIQDSLRRIVQRQTDPDLLAAFGYELFQHLFTGEIGIQLERATGFSIAQKEGGIRIRMRISAPELSALPWELLFTPSRSFIGTDHSSPIVRWLNIPQPIKSLQAELPLKFLLVIPEIHESSLKIETEKEIDVIKKALSGMKKEVELTILKENVTLERIGHLLIDQNFQVLHFIGHGKFTDDQGHLLLNGHQGQMRWVDENSFASILKNHAALKLIVLNACQGATVSGTQAFVGIAPRIIKAGIPAVIAMQYPIYDTAAVVFASELYYSLFRGPNTGRIDWAMVHARNALLREFPGEREIAAPVLYMRAPEGVLFYKYTGNRYRDAVFSSNARDTEKAV
jgi:hypothetical protein